MRAYTALALLLPSLALAQSGSFAGKWAGRFEAEDKSFIEGYRGNQQALKELMAALRTSKLVLNLGNDHKFNLKLSSGPSTVKKIFPGISGTWSESSYAVELHLAKKSAGSFLFMKEKQGKALRCRMPFRDFAMWIVCTR